MVLKKLVVISHTGHYYNEKGSVCGWIPTVRELDFLAQYFEEVVHVAVLHKQNITIPLGVTPYQAKNIRFVALPFYGGPGLSGKWSIIRNTPFIIQTTLREIKSADFFQFRAPTSIGVFLIPILTLFTNKKGWYKYAGNWMQPNKPLSYRIQKWLLQYFQKRPVTINGKWPRQLKHIYSFENPCLTEADRENGVNSVKNKKINEGGVIACFVGRLETAKGVDRIIKALPVFYKKGVKQIHFVGDGIKRETYEKATKDSLVDCVFHGFLSREAIFQVYKESHLNLLPSDTEGFPKVIAEGANFGCVPVVSAVSAIPQYVNDENGYLWDIETCFTGFIETCDFHENKLQHKSRRAIEIATFFTLEYYWEKLNENIFN